VTLEPGKAADVAFKVTVASNARYSQPYWHRNPKVDRYEVDNPADFPLPWSPPTSSPSCATGARRDRA
jgi:hypothetical protein